MQQASDCDIVLAHDYDLVTVIQQGIGTVSGFLNSSYIILLKLLVTGNFQTRRDV